MHSRRLPNYVRGHRKRGGLSQEELAFLLSCHGGACISRYEHFKQQPTIETAIALEILFRTPVRGLFDGVSEKVERKIAKRVKALLFRLERAPQTRANIRKLETLEAIRACLGQSSPEGA